MTTLDSILASPFYPALKQRNEFFDNLFYDVGSLSAKEKQQLSPIVNREGSVIVVAPSDAVHPIHSYQNTAEFLESEHSNVRALIVAGVGSSVIGTAALARNVADACDLEVAGVVSGYGASDMITEAMGGWFFYGAADAFRLQLRKAMDYWDDYFTEKPFDMRIDKPASSKKEFFPRNRDINAVADILESATSNISLVVGHSKGNLLVDFALERFVKKIGRKGHRYFDDLNIVTLGAVTNFPDKFKNVHQYIGSIDWFGALNSRLDIEHRLVNGAWHHLNTRYPSHLSVQAVLAELGSPS